MTDDDKKELAKIELLTTQLKYGLMFSLGISALAIPFFFMIIETTNLIYPLIVAVIGWVIGHYYAKFTK